jgi:hypothetical protein
MVAISGFLQWFFLGLLVTLTAVSGVIALYIVVRLVENPRRQANRNATR